PSLAESVSMVAQLLNRCRSLGGLLAAGIVFVLIPVFAHGQRARRDGLYVLVPNPITEKAVGKIKQRIEETLAKGQRNIEVVIFDFNPGDHPKASATSDFAQCLNLAGLIKELNSGGKITTVAFVRNEATKHTVLPVLSCAELILS